MNRIAPWLALGLLSAPAASAPREIHHQQSRYHDLWVSQDGSLRTLHFRRKGVDYDESAIDIDKPLRLPFQYYRQMFAGFLFVPEPKRMLMLGLGGGTLPRAFHHYFPETEMLVVELDPAVLDVARRFFLFKESPQLRVQIRDGRVAVKAMRIKKERFDLIFLDAFRGGYVPYHLTTKEFNQECRDLLSPGGAVVANLRSDFRLYEYQRRTMDQVFPQQYVFGTWGNMIDVALRDPKKVTVEELRARGERLKAKRRLNFDIQDVIRQYQTQPDYPTKGAILTDDHAPANILRHQPRE